jgi:predicted transcriptional regulator
MTPVEALTSQVALYRKLQKFCEKQRQFVQQNRIDEFVAILEARGEILQEIARLEHEVTPLKRDWPQQAAAMDDATRAAAADMLAETKLLLEQITQADQDDVLLLQQRKLNVGKQIAATQTARKVNTRYAAAAYGNASGSKLNLQK